jgi:hypothetical protein
VFNSVSVRTSGRRCSRVDALGFISAHGDEHDPEFRAFQECGWFPPSPYFETELGHGATVPQLLRWCAEHRLLRWTGITLGSRYCMPVRVRLIDTSELSRQSPHAWCRPLRWIRWCATPSRHAASFRPFTVQCRVHSGVRGLCAHFNNLCVHRCRKIRASSWYHLVQRAELNAVICAWRRFSTCNRTRLAVFRLLRQPYMF